MQKWISLVSSDILKNFRNTNSELETGEFPSKKCIVVANSNRQFLYENRTIAAIIEADLQYFNSFFDKGKPGENRGHKTMGLTPLRVEMIARLPNKGSANFPYPTLA
jgi:hypothetical protein